MTERKPHPENELIDELTESATPSQSSSSGGDVNRDVGSRADMERATDPEAREPVTGSYNPEENADKGEKTPEAIKKGQQG